MSLYRLLHHGYIIRNTDDLYEIDYQSKHISYCSNSLCVPIFAIRHPSFSSLSIGRRADSVPDKVIQYVDERLRGLGLRDAELLYFGSHTD